MKMTEIISSVSTVLSPGVTALTKGIKTTANATSSYMDQLGGGTALHGGYHRVCGGHSICDLALWKKFGLDYPVELAKDIITPFGLPLPGVETLVNAGHVSKTFATKYLSLNIGNALGGSIAVVDSAFNLKKLLKSEIDESNLKTLILKGAIKGVVGASTSNPLLLIAVGSDLVVVSILALQGCVAIDLEEEAPLFY